jgi:hypothetical protein
MGAIDSVLNYELTFVAKQDCDHEIELLGLSDELWVVYQSDAALDSGRTYQNHVERRKYHGKDSPINSRHDEEVEYLVGSTIHERCVP